MNEPGKQHYQKRLSELAELISPAVVGKYDVKVKLPPESDDFYEIYVGVDLLYEVIREKIKELEDLNAELGNKINAATEDLQEAQAIAGLGSWAWNIQEDKLEWSPQLYKMFGLDPKKFEATFAGYLEIVHPEDKAFIEKLIQETLKSHKPFSFDHRLLRDGKVIWIHADGQVSSNKDGKPIKMYGTAQDITERRNAEIELNKQQESLSAFFDAAPDALIVASHEGKIEQANKHATEIFGYTHTEILSSKVEDLMPNRYRERHVGHRTNYQQSPRKRPMGQSLELFAIKKDGTEFPVEISLSPLHLHDQPLTIAIIRDVTERKRTEKEIQERTDELAKFNQLMVGRELKMAELKEEIEKLKRRLDEK